MEEVRPKPKTRKLKQKIFYTQKAERHTLLK
jgi:hypothetical protein